MMGTADAPSADCMALRSSWSLLQAAFGLLPGKQAFRSDENLRL